MSESRGVSLHTRILFALILGIACGLAANVFVPRSSEYHPRLEGLIYYVMEPIGDIFLRLLKLTVVPLVFSSLALGVAQLGSQGNLGRIGLKSFGFFLITMTFAVTIGLTMVNVIEPGKSMPQETQEDMKQRYATKAKDAEKRGQTTELDTRALVKMIVPDNPLAAMTANPPEMLAIIFFALLVGMGLPHLEPNRRQIVLSVLGAMNDLMVIIIGWAMRIAPYGVFALIFSVASLFGLELFKALAWFVGIVIVGIGLQMFGVLSILLVVLARISPWTFFRKVRPIMITAFSTSSSSATLPTSIAVAEKELGIPPPIAGFVLPLGATMNMNGTALFEGVTVMFLAQVYGIDLSLDQQIIVVVMAVVTAIGAAGVPGGSLPLLAIVLTMVGVPAEGLAIILGVDRLLDMCRTTLNVIGDVAAATYVTRSEGYPLLPESSAVGESPPAV